MENGQITGAITILANDERRSPRDYGHTGRREQNGTGTRLESGKTVGPQNFPRRCQTAGKLRAEGLSVRGVAELGVSVHKLQNALHG